MIRMHIVIIMTTTMRATVGIITKEDISLATKTANVAAVRASAVATMATVGIITPKVSVGTGTAIRIEV